MLNKILILIFLINSLQKTDTRRPIKRFSCSSSKRIHEIRNVNQSLKRLLRDGHHYYFVFKHYIVFFKLPILTNVESNFYVKNDDSYEHPYLFQHSTFYEQANEEDMLPNSIPNEYNVLGHYYVYEKNEVAEFYYKKSTRTLRKQRSDAEIYENLYYLDFDKDVLAKRDKLGDITKFLMNSFGYHYVTNLILYGDHNWVNTFVKNNQQFYVRFENDIIDKRNNFFIAFHISGIQFYGKEFMIYTRIYNVPYVKFFVVDDLELPRSAKNDLMKFSMLGFNEQNSKIYLAKYYVKFLIPKYEIEITQDVPEKNFVFNYDVDELFNCHTAYSEDRQIKGIYYNQNRRIFFIFIKRFYLKLTDDLVSNGFYFDEKIVYENNAYDLEFENEMIYETVYFEMMKRKWIKNVANDSFLIPSDVHQNQFKLSVDENQNLLIKQENAPKNQIECLKQTLILEDNFYCLSEKFYFDDDQHVYSIHKIFKDSPVEWDKDQKLKYIFNYDLDQLIFLTETHLFKFKYKNFGIDKSYSQEIIFRNCPGFYPTKTKSCLLVKCKYPITTTTTKRTTTEEATTEQVTTKEATTEQVTTKETTGGTTEETTENMTITEETTKSRTTVRSTDLIIVDVITKPENETNAERLARSTEEKNLIKFLAILCLVLFLIFLVFCFVRIKRKKSSSLRKIKPKILTISSNQSTDSKKLKSKTVSKNLKSKTVSKKSFSKLIKKIESPISLQSKNSFNSNKSSSSSLKIKPKNKTSSNLKKIAPKDSSKTLKSKKKKNKYWK